jgi:hypothetical protein
VAPVGIAKDDPGNDATSGTLDDIQQMLGEVVGMMVIVMVRRLDGVPLSAREFDVVNLPHNPLLWRQNARSI